MKMRALWLYAVVGFASMAQAQTIDIPNITGAPGDTVQATISFTSGAQDIASWDLDIEYNRSLVDVVSFTECPVSTGAASPGSINCTVEADGQFDVFRVGMFTAPSAAIGSGDVAIIEFTIPPGASPQTVLFQEDSFNAFAPDGTNVSGSVTVNVGTFTIEVDGPSLSFTPAGDGTNTLDTGTAKVNVGTTQTSVTVLENGTENVVLDSCTVSGANAGDFSVSYSGTDAPLPATFTGGSGDSGNLIVQCAPTGDGTRTAQLACDVQDAGSATVASPTWDLTCEGDLPDLQYTSTSVSLSGNVGGTNPTGSTQVSNVAPVANATNASIVLTSADTPEISITDGLTDATIAAGETDTLSFSCDAASAGDFTETFVIEYEDTSTSPSGTAQTAEVTVSCSISDTAPQYGSDPTPGTTLSFSTDFGTTSAVEPIDVFNANSNTSADPLEITSATASDPVFNVNLINTTFQPDSGGAADGTTDIEVSCSPTGVGLVTGTLTVESNDGTQNYPLECQGTGDFMTTTPAAGGTLNLGSVPPNTATPEGSILFTNNDLDDTIDVTCSVSDPDGVFTVTPDPVEFTVAPGATESAVFQCTPPQVESYSAAVSCSGQFVVRGAPFVGDYTVTCSGRPLVIPTLSNWGLILMSLVLLTIGGLVGRRMLG